MDPDFFPSLFNDEQTLLTIVPRLFVTLQNCRKGGLKHLKFFISNIIIITIKIKILY